VHCAAIVGPTNTPLAEVKVEDFDQVYEVNLRGSMIVTKQALKAMLPNKYGRILLLASIAGKEGNAGMSPYSSTKAGVIGLVKSAGKDYAESGVTINALAPAVIRTPMVDECHPDQVKYMTDKIPMKRCGTLDEVAAIACWIVSREAGFNTGATFDLSGGRAVY
jgi:3-oxoacyl-[acyl-carrier protein] reductase